MCSELGHILSSKPTNNISSELGRILPTKSTNNIGLGVGRMSIVRSGRVGHVCVRWFFGFIYFRLDLAGRCDVGFIAC